MAVALTILLSFWKNSFKKVFKMLAKAMKLVIGVQILTAIISVQLVTAGEAEATKACEVLDDKFDFIIYDGGTSGSALARRLSDNPNWKVLLLVTGGDGSADNKFPLNVNRLALGCSNTFGYKYEQNDGYCLAMNNGQCLAHDSNDLGGTSLLGDMIYSRGNRQDYDNWCRHHGNHGWCYKDVLPFFKKVENYNIPGSKAKYCGKGGPITVSLANYRTELASAFLNAGKDLHYRTGFSLPETTIKNGLRQNSYSAYLEPVIEDRKNLVIRKNAIFTKLIFDQEQHKHATRVAGLEYKQLGFVHKVFAKHEVILSASAIGNAHYLLLSGIGPAKHLKQHNITVIKDLPVGYNYHEVVGVGGLDFSSDIKVLDLENEFTENNLLEFLKSGKGPVSSPVIEALAYLESSKQCHGYPDYELTLRAAGLPSLPFRRRRFNINETVFSSFVGPATIPKPEIFSIVPSVLRPKSRGRVLLRSADPSDLPIIEGGFYSNPHDIKIAVKSIKTTLKLAETKAFKKINAKFSDKLYAPCAHLAKGDRCHADDKKYWECFARHWTFPLERYAGTTKMGPAHDRTAVVDAKLRVHGIKNLRIVSSSVLPQQISGHADGVKYMIAEKAANIIHKCYHSHHSHSQESWSHSSDSREHHPGHHEGHHQHKSGHYHSS
jgi:choline dehydrogenase-like flavoprotein